MATLEAQTEPSGSMPPQATNTKASHPFTCNTCQVAFRSSDMQRAHMQTDWHRYNLKRRVASLPPLSSEIFTEKVLANKASAAATAAKASYEKLCAACNKTYYSENAYVNHLNSQKHRSNEAARVKNGAPSEAGDDSASMLSSAISLGESVDTRRKSEGDPEANEDLKNMVNGMKDASLGERPPTTRRSTGPSRSSTEDEKPTLKRSSTEVAPGAIMPASLEKAEKSPLLTCLFCNYASPTPPLNVTHMCKHHSFYIPDQEYLADLEGLVKHLFSKINEKHVCIKCGRYGKNAAGVQTHMRDKGHTMIGMPTEEDAILLGDYYDFSSTWSDEEDDDTDTPDSSSTAEGGGVKLGAPRDEEMLDAGKEDEGWETDSTISDVPSEEIGSLPRDPDRPRLYEELPKHRHHARSQQRKHRGADGYHSHAHTKPTAVYYDDYELHLPSGRTAGHRSLNRYFRQNLRDYPSEAEKMAQRAITEGDSDTEMADANSGEGTEERGRGRDPRNQQRQMVTRANGGLGMVGVTEAKKKETMKLAKKARRQNQQEGARFLQSVQKRANHQKHFRDPLLQ